MDDLQLYPSQCCQGNLIISNMTLFSSATRMQLSRQMLSEIKSITIFFFRQNPHMTQIHPFWHRNKTLGSVNTKKGRVVVVVINRVVIK